MMDDRKKQLIEDLISHLEGSQSDDLMGLINKSKPPGMDDAMPPDAKGISVKKIDVIGKPEGGDYDSKVNDAISGIGKEGSPEEEASESPMEEAKEPGEGDEMTDDELAQLLKEYLQK